MLSMNSMTLDWLSWTFDPYDYSVSKIRKFFTVFPELEVENMYQKQVFSHYEKAFCVRDEILIYYDEEDGQNKGVNVSVPSHGLEWLFNQFNVKTVSEMLALIIDRGGKISRLDFAYDDFSKSYMPLDYFNWWQNGNFKSKFRVAHFDHGADGGTTFALGNRAGLRYLRIYDKDIESKGKVKAVRYEFELHSYTANALAYSIAFEKRFCFRDFILSMFSIIENTGKSQKCREKLNIDWFYWVDNLKFNEELVKIPTGLQGSTVEKNVVWFETYCVKTLAKMFYLFGPEYIDEIARSAFLRLSRSELDTILNAKEYKYSKYMEV